MKSSKKVKAVRAPLDKQSAPRVQVKTVIFGALSPVEKIAFGNGEHIELYRQKNNRVEDKDRQVNCYFEDWWGHLDPEYQDITLPQWCAKSRQGRWANYMKSLSQKERPVWARSEIAVWFEMCFAKTKPHSLASLLSDNFQLPSVAKSVSSRPKRHGAQKRKAKIELGDAERSRSAMPLKRYGKMSDPSND